MRRLFQRIDQTLLQSIEAGLLGLFFVQGIRYLIGAYYSRIASASITRLLDEATLASIAEIPGVVLPQVVNSEVMFLVYMLALPLLTLILGRFRVLLIVGVVLTAGGRTLMVAGTQITPAMAAALTVGGGLFYIAMVLRHRPRAFPYLMILGIGVDQIIRAVGSTTDPTLSPAFYNAQLGLAGAALLLSLINLSAQSGRGRNGLMTFWGGLSFGALLFLELALLALPNAIVGRAGIDDYATIAPAVVIATLLPIVPWVRGRARNFISLFDASVHGWAWLLMLALLLVLGTRVPGVAAAVALVVAQFVASMIWWWLVRPQSESEGNVTGLWVVMGTLIFGLLIIADIFTYEYGYVRGFVPELAALNNIVLPLLRGFRGLGFAVLLLAALLAALPMIQTQRRIPWQGGKLVPSIFTGLVVIGAGLGTAQAARPVVIFPVTGVDSIRVGTYNIHGGYSEFYNFDLEALAQTIEQSGANVVLLQEVETGRLTSFGVDQALWLARRLGMDRRFYPTNEGLQGLAVLSNVEIVFDDGELLASVGQQTGLQRVQVRADGNVIVTIYNTWLGLLLESIGDRTIEEQEQDQQQQLNDIIRIINQHHPNRQLGRTVVGGTFNNIPDSPLVQRMVDLGFSDPFAGSPIERSATLSRLGLNARVDYLWLYPEIADGVGVMDTRASDHRMAFVNIRLSTAPPAQ